MIWGVVIALIVMVAVIYWYGRYVLPHKISVTHKDIVSPLLTEDFQDISILQFSDTHLGRHYLLGHLEELVDSINRLEPSIITFTGDLFDRYDQTVLKKEEVIMALSRLHAPLGKFAVYGNHDYDGRGSELYKEYLSEAGFRVLVNEVCDITLENGNEMTIAGLDDFLLGKPDIERTLTQLQPDRFNLLLVHEPDIVDRVKAYPVHLQLSGHTHAGQVQLPFLGPVITPSLGRKYVEGMYVLPTDSNTHLYVNRGIGTTRLKIRYGSIPELAVFHLRRKT
nr:metallophosphoesterase [Brevibacillus daliensis]